MWRRGAYGIVRRQVLNFNGHLIAFRSACPRKTAASVLTNEAGELFDATGEPQLPYMFARLGSLPIEPLSADGQSTWQTQRRLCCRSARERLRTVWPPFSTVPRPAGHNHKLRKSRSYPRWKPRRSRWEAASGDQLVIRKRHEFKTMNKAGTPTLLQVTGEGTFTFDQRLGVPGENGIPQSMRVRSQGNITDHHSGNHDLEPRRSKVSTKLWRSHRRLGPPLLPKAGYEPTGPRNTKDQRRTASHPTACHPIRGGLQQANPPHRRCRPQEVDRLIAELTTEAKIYRPKNCRQTSRMQPLAKRRKVTRRRSGPMHAALHGHDPHDGRLGQGNVPANYARPG